MVHPEPTISASTPVRIAFSRIEAEAGTTMVHHGNFLSPDQPGKSGEIRIPAIGTGADKDLVDWHTCYRIYGFYRVHTVRYSDKGYDIPESKSSSLRYIQDSGS